MNGQGSFPLKWIYWLSTIVILAATFSVIAVMFISPDPTLAQYRIAIALICFVLSSISGLLFAAKVQLNGKIGVISMTLAGPAVMWLAALLIITLIFPDKDIITQQELTLKLANLVHELRAEKGCSSYTEWKKNLGSLQRYFKKDEEFQLGQYLTSVYYDGHERNKLNGPIVQTLFVYFGNKTLKFQRIQGKKEGTAHIYFNAATTFPGSSTSSVLLVRENDRIAAGYTESSGNWQEITAEPVDCLIMTSYEEEVPVGDFLSIDLTKYLKNGSATIDLGIIASRQIKGPSFSLWKIRGFRFADTNDVPLSFERLPVTANANINSLISGLLPWMKLIDKSINQAQSQSQLTPEVLLFLTQISTVFHQATSPKFNFETFLSHPNLNSKFSFHVENLRDPLIATFEWGQ